MPRGGALLFLILFASTSCSIVPTARPSLDGTVVDADAPVFSNPTSITNPLFPVSDVAQLVQLGVDGGQPLRVEVTLMPETRIIDWDGGTVETVVAQFIAYRDRRVIEVAYDFFAQADDGSVWYFGETVDNYAGGRVSNNNGAWLAGVDGPPGMIMPGEPRVGDIYHPENIPGVVFEELIVLETGLTVDGPSGPISNAIRVEEHLMDGGTEQKIWAPGYGEFRTETTNELVTVAVAVPTDALSGSLPQALSELRMAAVVLASGTSGDVEERDAAIESISTSWAEYRPGAAPLVADEMEAALDALASAAEAGSVASATQAGIDVVQAALDLELRHRTPAAVDLNRIEAWMHQLILDTNAGDEALTRGDAAIASVIWARAADSVDPTGRQRVESSLEALAGAVDSGDSDEMRNAATGLMGAIAALGAE